MHHVILDTPVDAVARANTRVKVVILSWLALTVAGLACAASVLDKLVHNDGHAGCVAPTLQNGLIFENAHSLGGSDGLECQGDCYSRTLAMGFASVFQIVYTVIAILGSAAMLVVGGSLTSALQLLTKSAWTVPHAAVLFFVAIVCLGISGGTVSGSVPCNCYAPCVATLPQRAPVVSLFLAVQVFLVITSAVFLYVNPNHTNATL